MPDHTKPPTETDPKQKVDETNPAEPKSPSAADIVRMGTTVALGLISLYRIYKRGTAEVSEQQPENRNTKPDLEKPIVTNRTPPVIDPIGKSNPKRIAVYGYQNVQPGRWHVGAKSNATSYILTGAPPIVVSSEYMLGQSVWEVFHLYEDNYFIYNMGMNELTGTWSIENNLITLYWSNNSQSTVSLSEDHCYLMAGNKLFQRYQID